MTSVTISGAGAHAAAAGTDRIPASKAGVKGYLTNDVIGAYFAAATLAAGTLTASSPHAISQTWNAGSVTFTGFEIDITDTASAAASLIADFRRNNSSIFSVSKLGALIAAASLTAPLVTSAAGADLQVYGPSSKALQLGGGGSTQWQIPSSGHLLAETDNTNDIGAAAATRPRNIYVGTDVIAGGNVQAASLLRSDADIRLAASGLLYWIGRSQLSSPSDGVALLWNNAQSDFDRLQFGGTTASFPALKRSGANLQARLADDSSLTDFEAADLIASHFIGSGGGAAGQITIDGAAFNGNIYFGIAGVGNRWQINGSTGNILAVFDNSYDIGSAGANRPKDGYFAGTLSFGVHTATPLTISGYITITDAGGTTRKLAVVT